MINTRIYYKILVHYIRSLRLLKRNDYKMLKRERDIFGSYVRNPTAIVTLNVEEASLVLKRNVYVHVFNTYRGTNK